MSISDLKFRANVLLRKKNLTQIGYLKDRTVLHIESTAFHPNLVGEVR
jgi:hypothetical protein